MKLESSWTVIFGRPMQRPREKARVVDHAKSADHGTLNHVNRWRSGKMKATAFLAFSIPLWAYLVTESKIYLVASRFLVVASLAGPMRPANGGSFNGKLSARLTLSSKSTSLCKTSRALAPNLSNMATTGLSIKLIEIGLFWGFMVTMARPSRHPDRAGEGKCRGSS